jgi:hypothetical protein
MDEALFKKKALGKEIVKKIQRAEGRFLKQTKSGMWIEVDEPAAREKVSPVSLNDETTRETPSAFHSTNFKLHNRCTVRQYHIIC